MVTSKTTFQGWILREDWDKKKYIKKSIHVQKSANIFWEEMTKEIMTIGGKGHSGKNWDSLEI